MSAMPRKPRPLERMFNDVPPTYDAMNRLLTFGLDRRWRNAAARMLLSCEPSSVLDLCTGTGDFALRLADLAESPLRIVGIDFSGPMIAIAQEKCTRSGVEGVEFIEGDAADLPFEDSSFDAVGISFAFRNLIYRNPLTSRALSDVRRVLRPGGVFVGVESWQPASKVVRFFRDIYVEIMAARLGARVSGNKAAYRYLANSIKRFQSPSEIVELLKGHGFATIECHPKLFGAAGVFVAWSE